MGNNTIIKLKLRSRGPSVCIYDTNLNLVKSFSTIKETPKFVGLSPSSVSKYLAKGTFLNNTSYFKFTQDIKFV